MSCWGFIFARGGSKGLPRKNILELNGIPLIAHSVNAALNCDQIDRVFVSTDDEQIADAAKAAGAEVPFMRPPQLAQDTSPEWLAWQHAVTEVKKRYGEFETFISLPPTAPCRTVSDVERCIAALTPDVDIVVTVSESNQNPYFNMLKRDASGTWSKFCETDGDVVRRQDVCQAYNMTPVAYVTRPEFILASSSMWAGRMQAVVVDSLNAPDIDTKAEFALAELILSQRQAK